MCLKAVLAFTTALTPTRGLKPLSHHECSSMPNRQPKHPRHQYHSARTCPSPQTLGHTFPHDPQRHRQQKQHAWPITPLQSVGHRVNHRHAPTPQETRAQPLRCLHVCLMTSSCVPTVNTVCRKPSKKILRQISLFAVFLSACPRHCQPFEPHQWQSHNLPKCNKLCKYA